MSKHPALQLAVDKCQTVLTDKEQRIQHSDIVQTCDGDHTVSYLMGIRFLSQEVSDRSVKLTKRDSVVQR